MDAPCLTWWRAYSLHGWRVDKKNAQALSSVVSRLNLGVIGQPSIG
jgi:hypothetical protein